MKKKIKLNKKSKLKNKIYKKFKKLLKKYQYNKLKC